MVKGARKVLCFARRAKRAHDATSCCLSIFARSTLSDDTLYCIGRAEWTARQTAAPGRKRRMSVSPSTIGRKARLIVTGVRRWSALPDRRPVTVVAVVLIAVLLGAFGAAAGPWLGARALADLPSEATLADLTRRTAGVNEAPVSSRETSPRTAARFVRGSSPSGALLEQGI
ncbi:hypothetical protein GCM10027614_50930 [Micromonospora vulcania]